MNTTSLQLTMLMALTIASNGFASNPWFNNSYEPTDTHYFLEHYPTTFNNCTYATPLTDSQPIESLNSKIARDQRALVTTHKQSIQEAIDLITQAYQPSYTQWDKNRFFNKGTHLLYMCKHTHGQDAPISEELSQVLGSMPRHAENDFFKTTAARMGETVIIYEAALPTNLTTKYLCVIQLATHLMETLDQWPAD